VLRAEIGPPPGLGPDHSKILPLRQRRSVRQHKLDVVAPGAGRIPARERQRMVGSSDRDQLDAADPGALDPGDLHFERSGDPDRGRAVEHHLRHRPERFDIKA